jgi:hypothetical protein
MPTSLSATDMGSLDLVRAFTPGNGQKRTLRASVSDRFISDWKRLDILVAIWESEMEVFAGLFSSADTDSTPPHTSASRMPLHLENQLASRFRHFWIE